MIDLNLQNYVEWEVTNAFAIRGVYGYRVILKYMDGSVKSQQKSGFATLKLANKAREKAIAELYSGTYIVHNNVKVSELMEYWLEYDIKERAGSYGTYATFRSVVLNHVNPAIGKKKMDELNRGDIQKLYNDVASYSFSVAKNLKCVINLSMQYAISKKIIAIDPSEGINLPKNIPKKPYRTMNIDSQKTLTLEQIQLLIEESKKTPIHLMVLMNVLMGLRRSEIIAVKYSDIDYINRTLSVERQLGRKLNTNKEDFAPKTFTKQEVRLKTKSSKRVIPIPDLVFEEILKERQLYEKHRNRRKREFQDLDYICCSTYGRPRSKDFHWKYYKKLLADCGLPDIRWHDLRSTYCTLLLKNDFNPKAVSKLMGHAKEIVTIDVYGDNKGIISEGVPEITEYMEDVLPTISQEDSFKQELLEVVIDTSEYMKEVENGSSSE